MKGRKLLAAYLLCTLAAVCFISAPAFGDSPWDSDEKDESTTGGNLSRDDSRHSIGSAMDLVFLPGPTTNIGVSVYLFTLDYSTSQRTVQREELTKVDRTSRKASRRYTPRRFR